MVPVAPCYFAFLESCAGEYRNGLVCFYSIKPTRLITCILPCMGYAIKAWSHVFSQIHIICPFLPTLVCIFALLKFPEQFFSVDNFSEP